MNGKGTKEKEDYLLRNLMIRDVFFLLFPSPLHPLLSTNKNALFQAFSRVTTPSEGEIDGFRNSLEFGAGEHTAAGEDEMDAVEARRSRKMMT